VHVSQRAFLVPAVLQFFQRITIRNFAGFIETPGRTPTATLDSMFERNVERRAIHSSLSAGNNSQDVDLILGWQASRPHFLQVGAIDLNRPQCQSGSDFNRR
jgi:hypothetical protein